MLSCTFKNNTGSAGQPLFANLSQDRLDQPQARGRVSLSEERCACGITLPVVNVEGRTDEILRFKTCYGQLIPILPLALWSVPKETPGVLKFQAIQTKSDELEIRLETKCAEEFNDVWKRVYLNARDYLAQLGLENVCIARAAEPPMRDPKSGKFRNVWVENVSS